MDSKLIHEEGGEKTFVLVFDEGNEVVLVEPPDHLKKRTDEETALALIDIRD